MSKTFKWGVRCKKAGESGHLVRTISLRRKRPANSGNWLLANAYVFLVNNVFDDAPGVYRRMTDESWARAVTYSHIQCESKKVAPLKLFAIFLLVVDLCK